MRSKSKKKLSIGVIQQSPDVGGAETYMVSLLTEFKRRGNEVHFATNLDRFLSLVEPVQVSSYKIPVYIDYISNIRGFIKSTLFLPYALYYYTQLLLKFKKSGVDVILLTGFSEKMLVSLLSLLFSLPVVWIEYGSSKEMVSRVFYFPKLMYLLCKGIPQYVVASSKYAKHGMTQYAGLPEEKTKVIYCGVTVQPQKNQGTVLKEFSNKFVIGNVSRLTKEKGQHILIQAMPEIINKIPNAFLIIIGQGPDREFFEALVKKKNLKRYVQVLGYIENIETYYNSMDVFVFPSVWELEGFGLVVAEAMAHKIPVVASDVGPIPEVVENNVTGIVVKAGSKKEITKAVVDLYKNPKKRKKLGEMGYRRVTEKFDMRKVGDQFTELLAKIVKE